MCVVPSGGRAALGAHGTIVLKVPLEGAEV